MVRMPTTITRTRKKVAKPSTMSMPPKAGPPMEYAWTLAPSAAASASREMWPKAFDERLWMSGSSTVSRVPMTVRMISGRKRRASCGLKRKTGLTGTGDLRCGADTRVCRVGTLADAQGPPRRSGEMSLDATDTSVCATQARRPVPLLHPVGDVHVGLIQYARGDSADGRDRKS